MVVEIDPKVRELLHEGEVYITIDVEIARGVFGEMMRRWARAKREQGRGLAARADLRPGPQRHLRSVWRR